MADFRLLLNDGTSNLLLNDGSSVLLLNAKHTGVRLEGTHAIQKTVKRRLPKQIQIDFKFWVRASIKRNILKFLKLENKLKPIVDETSIQTLKKIKKRILKYVVREETQAILEEEIQDGIKDPAYLSKLLSLLMRKIHDR